MIGFIHKNKRTVFEVKSLFIDNDLLGKDLSEYDEVGLVLARYEMDGKHICLETNGESEDIYLEIVEYEVDDEGNYVEAGFSEPIYEVPENEDDVKKLFIMLLNQ